MNTKRRDFIKGIAAAGLMTTLPGSISAFPFERVPSHEKIWGALLHLSFNMWEEFISPHRPFRGFRPYLELSKKLWDDTLVKMAKSGVNMVLIDLGDAIKYESYPEIAVDDAWSTDQLRRELAAIRKLGIEPIPKLNFSAGHDTWMRDYSRMVSTKPYYEFCENIIKEVSDLFDKPRFFHLGMDEETERHQRHQLYTVIRRNDVYWKDFYFLVDQVEKNGSQAWVWPDYYLWSDSKQFFKKMPKNVIQSNWYYGEEFPNKTNNRTDSYLKLEKYGYRQIPTGSFHTDNEQNFLKTIQYCSQHISDNNLMGFLQTYWKPTIEENRNRIIKGTELIGEAKVWYEKTFRQ